MNDEWWVAIHCGASDNAVGSWEDFLQVEWYFPESA